MPIVADARPERCTTGPVAARSGRDKWPVAPPPPVAGLDWAGTPCRQVDPELWFPEQGVSAQPAKKICARSCELRAECLELALENDERFGVWGGLSARQRHSLKRKRAAAAAASARRQAEAELAEAVDLVDVVAGVAA
jgi:WhiB family redox-sensing transcriptional regulator